MTESREIGQEEEVGQEEKAYNAIQLLLNTLDKDSFVVVGRKTHTIAHFGMINENVLSVIDYLYEENMFGDEGSAIYVKLLENGEADIVIWPYKE